MMPAASATERPMFEGIGCFYWDNSFGMFVKFACSSSKFIRDDYSPWKALDVVRVSTRYMWEGYTTAHRTRVSHGAKKWGRVAEHF